MIGSIVLWKVCSCQIKPARTPIVQLDEGLKASIRAPFQGAAWNNSCIKTHLHQTCFILLPLFWTLFNNKKLQKAFIYSICLLSVWWLKKSRLACAAFKQNTLIYRRPVGLAGSIWCAVLKDAGWFISHSSDNSLKLLNCKHGASSVPGNTESKEFFCSG